MVWMIKTCVFLSMASIPLDLPQQQIQRNPSDARQESMRRCFPRHCNRQGVMQDTWKNVLKSHHHADMWVSTNSRWFVSIFVEKWFQTSKQSQSCRSTCLDESILVQRVWLFLSPKAVESGRYTFFGISILSFDPLKLLFWAYYRRPSPIANLWVIRRHVRFSRKMLGFYHLLIAEMVVLYGYPALAQCSPRFSRRRLSSPGQWDLPMMYIAMENPPFMEGETQAFPIWWQFQVNIYRRVTWCDFLYLETAWNGWFILGCARSHVLASTISLGWKAIRYQPISWALTKALNKYWSISTCHSLPTPKPWVVKPWQIEPSIVLSSCFPIHTYDGFLWSGFIPIDCSCSMSEK